jgi:seryl-tRNA synthetase
VFSKDLKHDVSEEIDKANKDILKRGSKKRGAKVVRHKLVKNRLDVEIISDETVRAHDGFIRLKKFLAEQIGRKYKVGIKEAKVDEYKIMFKLDHEVKKKISIPFAESVKIDKRQCVLRLKDLDLKMLMENYVDRMIKLIQEKSIDYGGKAEHWKLIWQSKKKKIAWTRDPSLEMEKANWIIRGKGRGQWFFSIPATQIIQAMVQVVEKELLEALRFKEVIIPKMVTWDTWIKSGHAKGIYPEIYYVATPKTRDPDFWEEICDYFKITREVPIEKIKEKIDGPIGGITYAQCPPFWDSVEKKILAKDSIPLKVFDRSGTSMRYESGGIHGIERVDEFHRIEIIWIDTPEGVEKIRQDLVSRFRYIFDRVLDLEWRMADVTPWFLAQEGKKDGPEGNIGTIDFEGYLPYKGKREGDAWLEFQNVSNNGPKYPEAFSVKGQKDILWSGCSGIGLERWLAVFIAQKGMDPENWPSRFKRIVGKLEKPFKWV